VTKYGLLQYLVSMVTINIPVLALEKDPEKSIAAITQAAEKAVKERWSLRNSAGLYGMSSLVDGVKSQLEARASKSQ